MRPVEGGFFGPSSGVIPYAGQISGVSGKKIIHFLMAGGIGVLIEAECSPCLDLIAVPGVFLSLFSLDFQH